MNKAERDRFCQITGSDGINDGWYTHTVAAFCQLVVDAFADPRAMDLLEETVRKNLPEDLFNEIMKD